MTPGSMSFANYTLIFSWALAYLLDLEAYTGVIPTRKLAEATAYFEDQENKIIEEYVALRSRVHCKSKTAWTPL
jgi:hypothetical protein